MASSVPRWIRDFLFPHVSRQLRGQQPEFGLSLLDLIQDEDISPLIMAVDTWSAIVFSLPRASSRISSCILALTARRRLTTLPAPESSPQARAAASSPNTTGASIMVNRRRTPAMPIPILVVSRAVSTLSAAFTPRRYRA